MFKGPVQGGPVKEGQREGLCSGAGGAFDEAGRVLRAGPCGAL